MPHVEIGFDVVAFFSLLVLGIFGFAQVKFTSSQNKLDLKEFKQITNERLNEINSRMTTAQSRHDDVWDEIKKDLNAISKSLARLEGKQSVREE